MHEKFSCHYISGMNYWALLIVSTVLEAAGDVGLKLWADGKWRAGLAMGVGLYAVATALWALVLKLKPLAVVVTLFTASNLIAAVLIGVFVFGERLTVVQWSGVLLAFAAIVLIELG